MTVPLANASPVAAAAPAGALEKAPLERYVPPEKPSLIGLSRPELAQALAAIGVPAAQRRM
ncbi:MAG: 23S rRNA (adenine(2503)-C(2))-methyltransferase RlmN, partial [Xanthobacteraceae bacterium]